MVFLVRQIERMPRDTVPTDTVLIMDGNQQEERARILKNGTWQNKVDASLQQEFPTEKPQTTAPALMN